MPWLECGGSRGVSGGGTHGGSSTTGGRAGLPSPEARGRLRVGMGRLMFAGRAGWNDGDTRLRLHRETG